jgi:hypothetical protein
MDKVMPGDMTLLREHSRRNSEDAFAAFVSRYLNLVYSVALRDVHDPKKETVRINLPPKIVKP